MIYLFVEYSLSHHKLVSQIQPRNEKAHQFIFFIIINIAVMFLLFLFAILFSSIFSLPAQNHTFYTSSYYTIPLGRNVVDVDIDSPLCTFDPSAPNLTLTTNVSVFNPSPDQWGEDEVFHRIRDLETEKAQFLAVANDYVFVLRGRNNIMIMSSSLTKLLNQYAIPELGNVTQSYKFKSNNSVVIISNGSMFTCDKYMYTSRKYIGTVNNSVYLNSTLFAVITNKRIEVYDTGNKDITLKRAFDQEDIKNLNKNINISNINFTTCKLRQQTLYCLCSSTGLYMIDSTRLTLISVIKKQNCIDFVPGNNSVYFQCEFYQDYFISSYPDTKVLSFFPSFIQSMQIFDKDLLLFQHASKVTFWNPSTKKQKQIDLNNHIVQVDIIRQYTVTGSTSTTLTTFLLVLFKGCLQKYEYLTTTPQLVCFSEKPISANVSYELQLIDGSKIQKDIKLEVSEYVNSINKKLIIGLIVILVTIIIGMILIVCYYEKIIRNLRGVYIYMKRKRNAGRHVEV